VEDVLLRLEEEFPNATMALSVWANWQNSGQDNLGYPSCSAFKKQRGSSGFDSGNPQAEKVDVILCNLKRLNRAEWVLSLNHYFLYKQSQSECAKRMQMSKPTFYGILRSALTWIECEVTRVI